MRYSIIHHDVREQFGLTISQYLVCDSIHQLSRRGVCTLGDTEISKFLGINRSHVWESKKHLLEIGLIEKFQDGLSTTQKWHDAVTYKSRYKKDKVLENPTKVLENPETYNIYKENNLGEVENFAGYEIVKDKETETSKPDRKDTSYLAVFQLWGAKYPLSWRANRTEIQAAKNVLAERGLKNAADALAFARKYFDDEYCPKIYSPCDLDRKWAKLAKYEPR